MANNSSTGKKWLFWPLFFNFRREQNNEVNAYQKPVSDLPQDYKPVADLEQASDMRYPRHFARA